MSILKALFRPSQKRIWRRLSREVRRRFHEGGLFTHSAVQARDDEWTITLDTFTSGDGKTSQTCTRLRAPYFNPEGFRFEIYRASIFSGMVKAPGMQDIEVGHPRFDQDFVIRGNVPRRVRRLFANERIRRLIDAQPGIRLSVKGHDGWLSELPAGADELHFESAGVIEDLAQLRTLFDLFAEVLQQVCHEGTAYEEDVRIHLRRLRLPRRRIKGKRILREAGGRSSRDRAAEALRRLGEEEMVDALLAAFGGDFGRLKAYDGEYRAEIIAALGDALKGPSGTHAASALAEINAVEALPRLRKALRRLGGGGRTSQAVSGEALPRLREVRGSLDPGGSTGRAISRAIKKLEARAALPRAAAAADVTVDTLPRAAREPGPDSATLPRGSRSSSG